VSSATAKPVDAELWRVPIDGGAARRIELGVRGINYARVDRSGRRITFVAQPLTQTGTQLWAMEHLLTPRPKSR
jgi:Tol biopolymer transport system component